MAMSTGRVRSGKMAVTTTVSVSMRPLDTTSVKRGRCHLFLNYQIIAEVGADTVGFSYSCISVHIFLCCIY